MKTYKPWSILFNGRYYTFAGGNGALGLNPQLFAYKKAAIALRDRVRQTSDEGKRNRESDWQEVEE